MHDKQIRRRRAVLALLVVVSLILLTDYFGESSNSPLHAVQRGIATVLSPVQSLASTVVSPVRNLAGDVSSTFDAKSKVANLNRQVNALRTEVAEYRQDAIENRYYTKLLKLDSDHNLNSYDLQSASVIGKNPSLWYQTVKVDRGLDAGVRQNDPVVGPGGLVGDVEHVGSNYSVVALLTSPAFAVGAEVQDTAGASGLVQPAVGNPYTLRLTHLPSSAQVSPAAMVVTSGFGDGTGTTHSLYPPGIPIGTVSTLNPQTSVYVNQQVNVTPLVDLQDLSVVQILTKPNSVGGR